VGGNEFGPDYDIAYEDIHVLDANSNGRNLGWPLCAGHCDSNDSPQCDCNKHDDPLYTYKHNGDNACVVGGFVYRTQDGNAQLEGAYIFGDYVRSMIP